MPEVSAASINNTKKSLDVLVKQSELQASGIDDINLLRTTRTTAHSSTIGGVTHVDIKLTTMEDRYISANRRDSVTVNEANSTKMRYLEMLRPVLQKGDKNSSRIVDDYQQLLTNAKRYGDQPELRRTNFVTSLQRFTGSCNNLLDKIQGFRLNAHTEINEKIDNLNSHLKELQQLNAQMVNRADLQAELVKRRDHITDEIARYIAIDVDYNQYGQVNLKADGFSTFLVREGSSYIQFKPAGELSNQQILNGGGTKLTYTTHDSNKQQGVAITENDISTSIIKSGEIGALIQARDVMLKESYDNISSMNKEVARRFNLHHNDHSPFPPKTSFLSTKQINPGTEINWGQKGDPLTFYALDAAGQQLSSSYDKIKPAEIDLSKVRSTAGTASATYKDLLQEINYQLDGKFNKARASLGKFVEGKANGDTDSNYLINNFGIIGTHNIDTGNYEFELEIEGNSFYGSKVEIVGITGPLGAQPQANMPDAFRVDKAQNYRSDQIFTVQGVAGAANTISFDVRVTGDNGKVSLGTVSFDIDTALQSQINVRPTSSAIAGEFATETAGHTGIGTVKLVDENGLDLGVNSGKDGYLLLETNSDEYRLAFNGSMFGEVAGMNDIFTIDAETGHINLRADIAADSSLLSTGEIQMSESFDKEFVVGDTKAHLELAFGGAALAAGDSFNIGGELFTLVAGVAANQNEVSVIGDARVNLAAAVNSHSILGNVIKAEFDVGTSQLKLEALEAGHAGNNVLVSTVLLGGATVQHANNPAVGNLPVTPLVGGKDKVEIIKLRHFSIGQDSYDFFEEIESLDLVRDVSISDSKLYRQISEVEKDYDISSNQVELLNAEFSRMMVMNKRELITEITKKMMDYRTSIGLNAKMMDNEDMIHGILGIGR